MSLKASGSHWCLQQGELSDEELFQKTVLISQGGDKLEEGLRLLSIFLSAEFEISKRYIYKLKSLCEFYCLDTTASVAETWEMMTLPRWERGQSLELKKKSKVSTILRPGHEKSRTTKQTEVLWDFKTSYNFTEV